MSREIALGLLRQGNTGSEILQILDVIAADNQQSINDTQDAAVSYITGETVTF